MGIRDLRAVRLTYTDTEPRGTWARWLSAGGHGGRAPAAASARGRPPLRSDMVSVTAADRGGVLWEGRWPLRAVRGHGRLNGLPEAWGSGERGAWQVPRPGGFRS